VHEGLWGANSDAADSADVAGGSPNLKAGALIMAAAAVEALADDTNLRRKAWDEGSMEVQDRTCSGSRRHGGAGGASISELGGCRRTGVLAMASAAARALAKEDEEEDC